MTDIHAIAVKLSPFSTQEPISWFRRAEIQFRLRKITDPRTQADYVLEAIPESVFPQVSAWLDQQSDDIAYTDIKAHLLKEYTLTVSARAQRLLAIPQQPLGDRTASNVWNEMQSLARLPGTDATTGKAPQIDLMRELWLQSIPSSVRAALHDSDDLPMADLIKKADDLITSTRASQKPTPVCFTEPRPTDEDSDVHAVHRQSSGGRQPPPDKKGQGRHTGPRGHLLASGICSYHDRYGDAARNCLTGCQWSKNGQRSRRQ